MSRNSSLQALVLSVRPFGEDNRIVKFLSKEKGIFEKYLPEVTGKEPQSGNT